MLGSTVGAVKAKRLLSVVLVGAVVAGGCFWRRYPARVEVHCQVLVAEAEKARDLVAAGRFTAESLPELTYPLERATAFATEARAHATVPPPSLIAFDALLARYRAYVDRVDVVRREAHGADAASAVAPLLEEVRGAADAVRRALAAGADRARSGAR